MKTIIFYQGQNELSFNLDSETTVNTLIGNFFERVNLFKKANAKLLNYSKPILLRIENSDKETLLNTGLTFEALQMKCKLQWTKQGRNRFKNNVAVCIEAVNLETRVFTDKDYEKLNEKLG